MANFQLDPDLLLDAVATKLADAILARPGFGDLIVKRVDEEIARAVDARVGTMIDRLLVERASETFAACDAAVELVRTETMRAARERVAESLPSKDDVRRESLAVIRDAVMRAFAPAVEKAAGHAASIAVAFDPEPGLPVPTPTPRRPARGPPAPVTPPTPNCYGRENGCKCFGCDPPF
jgi:hypothetical protein